MGKPAAAASLGDTGPVNISLNSEVLALTPFIARGTGTGWAVFAGEAMGVLVSREASDDKRGVSS